MLDQEQKQLFVRLATKYFSGISGISGLVQTTQSMYVKTTQEDGRTQNTGGHQRKNLPGRGGGQLTWSKCPCRGSTLDHSMLNLLTRFGRDQRIRKKGAGGERFTHITTTRFAELVDEDNAFAKICD